MIRFSVDLVFLSLKQENEEEKYENMKNTATRQNRILLSGH